MFASKGNTTAPLTASLPLSPSTLPLPSPPPSAISGSDRWRAGPRLDARQTSQAIRAQRYRKIHERPDRAPSSPSPAAGPLQGRIMLAAPRPEPVRVSQKVLFVELVDNRHHGLL